MLVLNVKDQFANDVEHGFKKQMVRIDRHDGRVDCKPGDTLTLYTGMRTKACRLLRKSTVTHTARIRIEATHMSINGHRLPSTIHCRDCEQTDNEFAQADGFEDGFMQMSEWFQETHGLPFEGTVIYWD